MHFLHRFGSPMLAITLLFAISMFMLSISMLLLVSSGESFKSLMVRGEGITLRKRDRTAITFSLPWKYVLQPYSFPPSDSPRSAETPRSDAKAFSLILRGLLGDVPNVASAILGNGQNATEAVSTNAEVVQSEAQADAPTQVSVVFKGAPSVVASILSAVNGIVGEATGIIGGVVGDATSVVGMIVGGVKSTGVTEVGLGGGAAAASSGEPQEFLSQSWGSRGMDRSSECFSNQYPDIQSEYGSINEYYLGI